MCLQIISNLNFNMFNAVRFSINYIATINCNIGPCPIQSNADVAKRNTNFNKVSPG